MILRNKGNICICIHIVQGQSCNPGKHTFVVVGGHHSQIILTMAILRDVVMYFIPTPGRGRMISPWNRWFLIDDVCFKKRQIFVLASQDVSVPHPINSMTYLLT